ncbi:MAG: hypothetical protein ACOX2L_03770 [Anaerolineae bacterium]|nr:hypothetical protein [Chloroflexota bacterium]
MMTKVRAWLDMLLDKAEAQPAVAPLLQMADENVVLGGVLGGALFLLLGLIGGAVNRGFLGALVGAASGLLLGVVLGAVCGSLLPSRNGETAVDIDLVDHGEGYSGGDPINGYLTISANRNTRLTGGSVFLACRAVYVYEGTAAEGDVAAELARDTKTLHVQELPIVPSGLLRRGAPLRYPFRLVLPDDPVPTHHGYGCSARWTLSARVDGSSQVLAQAQEELLVRSTVPAGAGQRSERVSTSSMAGELALTLQHTTFAEGETVRGRVIVSPAEDFVATELRAMLLRVENHPRGGDTIVYINGWNAETGRYRGESQPGGHGSTYVWLEDEADLAEEVRYTLGEKRLYDFSFDVPQQWRPTLLTDDGSVTWRVVAALSRPNGQDMRVHQGITVHTTAPRLARVLATDGEPDADQTPVDPVTP